MEQQFLVPAAPPNRIDPKNEHQFLSPEFFTGDARSTMSFFCSSSQNNRRQIRRRASIFDTTQPAMPQTFPPPQARCTSQSCCVAALHSSKAHTPVDENRPKVIKAAEMRVRMAKALGSRRNRIRTTDFWTSSIQSTRLVEKPVEYHLYRSVNSRSSWDFATLGRKSTHYC